MENTTDSLGRIRDRVDKIGAWSVFHCLRFAVPRQMVARVLLALVSAQDPWRLFLAQAQRVEE